MTKSNGDVEAATQVQSLGGKPSNGHGPLNGNGYHQNGGRRDSSQAFTPLLSQHNNGTATNNGEVTTLPPSTVLYESTPSNNNEWKAPEDLGGSVGWQSQPPLNTKLKFHFPYQRGRAE